jgi:hypothetical protein
VWPSLCPPAGPKGEGGLDDATGASGAAGGASYKQTSRATQLGKLGVCSNAGEQATMSCVSTVLLGNSTVQQGSNGGVVQLLLAWLCSGLQWRPGHRPKLGLVGDFDTLARPS